MQITVTDELAAAAKLTEADARLSLAVDLYVQQRLTLAQAAALAGMDRLSFQRHLGTRGIALHYGQEGFDLDLAELARRGV